MKTTFLLTLLLLPFVAQARLDLNPFYVWFGNSRVGFTRYSSVRITNRGEKPTTISANVFGSWTFSASSRCFGQILPNQSCSVEVRFRPDRAGNFNGTLSINSSEGTASVSLSGGGVRR